MAEHVRATVMRVGTAVLMQVHAMPERLRSASGERRELHFADGVEVRSSIHPEFVGPNVYLRGRNRNFDNVTAAHTHATITDAKVHHARVVAVLRSLNQKLDAEESPPPAPPAPAELDIETTTIE